MSIYRNIEIEPAKQRYAKRDPVTGSLENALPRTLSRIGLGKRPTIPGGAWFRHAPACVLAEGAPEPNRYRTAEHAP
jgi:hypothetical protein